MFNNHCGQIKSIIYIVGNALDKYCSVLCDMESPTNGGVALMASFAGESFQYSPWPLFLLQT